MSPSRLLDAHKYGHIESITEWAQRTMSSSRAAEYLSGSEFKKRRQAFEGHFEDGTRFFYAALNLGSQGLAKYGLLCCRFDALIFSNSAVLGGDSLREYWDAVAEAPDLDRIRADVRLEPEVSTVLLAAIKTPPAPPYDPMICSSRDDSWYIELIARLGPSVRDVASVTIRSVDRAAIINGFHLGTPEALTAFEQLVDVEAMLEDLGISIEETT